MEQSNYQIKLDKNIEKQTYGQTQISVATKTLSSTDYILVVLMAREYIFPFIKHTDFPLNIL